MENSKDEQIGFHKGSLATLAKEREELSRMVNIVEQLMQMHVSGLKELGVDLEQMAQQQQNSASNVSATSNKSMDELLK